MPALIISALTAATTTFRVETDLMPEKHVRHDLLELATAYAEYSVLVTTAELKPPGPQILYANGEFTRMTGYSVSELLGKTPRMLQGPKTDREVLAQLTRSLESGHDFIARATNYKRDGTPFELEWVISHLKNNAGQTTHYVAVQRDITGKRRATEDLAIFDAELRDASRELLSAVQKLEQAEQRIADSERAITMGKMAAGVVHDLSNMLTPIFGLVKVLHNLDTLPPAAKSLTEHLDVSVEHAVQMLGNLKQYHATGSISVDDDPIELRDLIHKIPDLTQPLREAHERPSGPGLSFAFDFRSRGLVAGNRTELLQVLMNLALNAIQVMPAGGTLLFGLEDEPANVVLTVSDTGPGMSGDFMERCFDPYVTGRTGGSGLGLSVCRQIIERHAGTIAAEAVEPTGVRFVIRLPRLERKTTDASLRVEHPSVLIIGPSRPADPLTTLLTQRGSTVATAASADEALQLFFDGDYQLVVADTGLNTTSAFDVTQALKRTSPDTPVVVVAANADSPNPANIPVHLQPDAIVDSHSTTAELEEILASLGLA